MFKLAPVLFFITLFTPFLYYISNQTYLSQNNDNSTLVINKPKEDLNSLDFTHILEQVQKQNDEQGPIKTLEINLQYNKINTLDFSNLNNMPQLESLSLNLTQNILNGDVWAGFQIFQSLPNLKNITFDFSIQGEYTKDMYDVYTLNPSLKNVDFLQYFDSLSSLQYFKLNIQSSNVQQVTQISALNNSEKLEGFYLNAFGAFFFDFDGFDQLDNIQNLNEFSLLSKYAKNDNIDQLGQFIINQQQLSYFELNLERADLINLDFLKGFSKTQLIKSFSFNALANKIESISGLSEAFSNMRNLEFLQLGFNENQITDIYPIGNMINVKNLKDFSVSFTLNGAISDISALNILKNNSKIINAVIQFSFDSVVSVEPLQYLGNCTDLQILQLYFSTNQIQSAEPLYPIAKLNNLIEDQIRIQFQENRGMQGFSEFRKAMIKKYPFAQNNILPFS